MELMQTLANMIHALERGYSFKEMTLAEVANITLQGKMALHTLQKQQSEISPS